MRTWIALASATILAASCSEPAVEAAVNVARAAETRPNGPEAPGLEAGPCAITGISTDADPGGLRVRAAASRESRELGRLYPGMDPEVFYHEDNPSLAEGLVGAQFTVDRVSGDWLRITEIDPVTDGVNPAGDLAPSRRNFQGSGWVHASKVRLLPADSVGREQPDPSAPAIDPPAGSDWNGDSVRIVGCRGRWAEVEHPDSGSRRPRAWLPSESNGRHADIMRAALETESAAH